MFARLLDPVYNGFGIDSVNLRHALSFAVGFSVITFLHICAGEQAPKWLAIQKPLPTTLWVAYPLYWFYCLSYPLVVGLNWSAQWLLRQVGLEPASEAEGMHSEEELRLLFAASQKQSGAPSIRREIILNAIDLRRRVARDVMRPRQEIASLSTEATIAECLETAEKTRYSRFPLTEGGNLDRALGVIHFKDLFALRLKARCGADLLPAARKLVYVPETARLERLLQLFLDRKLHFALVVDEYGGTLGMVTLENVLEELVGQIQDEFDQEKPLMTRLSEASWEIAGGLPLHALEELVGEPLVEEGITTVSGWVTHKLGGFPRLGDSLQLSQHELKVEEIDGMRVARLTLTRKPG